MLNTAENSFKTYEEFINLKDNCDDRLEYIDGLVCMSPSPSIAHQRISGNLFFELKSYLRGTKCDVFSAPTDIELVRGDSRNLVIPDISVICDKEGFTSNKYIGIPTLIVEILSPSNQAHDLVTKMNIYMRYGVREYWIVNPMKHSIDIYSMDENGGYEQYCVRHKTGKVESKIFQDIDIDMDAIFFGI